MVSRKHAQARVGAPEFKIGSCGFYCAPPEGRRTAGHRRRSTAPRSRAAGSVPEDSRVAWSPDATHRHDAHASPRWRTANATSYTATAASPQSGLCGFIISPGSAGSLRCKDDLRCGMETITDEVVARHAGQLVWDCDSARLHCCGIPYRRNASSPGVATVAPGACDSRYFSSLLPFSICSACGERWGS